MKSIDIELLRICLQVKKIADTLLNRFIMKQVSLRKDLLLC